MKKSQESLTVVLGLVMASKRKGPLFRKGGRGRGAGSESVDFDLEDDRVSGEPEESRPVYRRLPFGVHRYDPVHLPVPPAGTNRQALVDELIDQLPMLTEKGLRELNLALSHEIYKNKGKWTKPWKPVKYLTLELQVLVAMMMLRKNLRKWNLDVAIVGIGMMKEMTAIEGMAMQIVRELS